VRVHACHQDLAGGESADRMTKIYHARENRRSGSICQAAVSPVALKNPQRPIFIGVVRDVNEPAAY